MDETLTKKVPYQQITEAILEDKGVGEEKIDTWRYHDLFFSQFNSMTDNPYISAFSEYFEEFNINLDPEQIGEEYKRRELEAVEPQDSLYSGLEELSREYKLGIVTDGVPSLQQRKIEKLEIKEFMDMVVISHDFEALKASRKPFEHVEKNLDAESYTYVSHKDKDIKAAEEAGWSSIDACFGELEIN